MFFLVDCNNFYVSCERVFRPDLEKKPVVVLSNNDGCVIARSQEVKDMGVKMGEPLFKCKALLESHDTAIFSANFALYGDLSQRIMAILSTFTPDLEVYSVDEAFLWCPSDNLIELGVKIKTMIQQQLGIPVSIGIGKTKTLAKVANHFAKKRGWGVFSIHTCAEDEMLKQFNISDIWGIGRQHCKFLNRHGIYTAKQFKYLSEKWVQKQLHKPGLQTYLELHGKACIPLELVVEKRKSILSSRSFGYPISELGPLQAALAANIVKAAEKLRQEKQRAKHITVFIRSSPFKDGFVSRSKQLSLFEHSSDTTEWIRAAQYALKEIFQKGIPYVKSGVLLTDFCDDVTTQAGLFKQMTGKNSLKQDTVMRVIDQLNHEWGRHTIQPAIVQVKQERWGMKQNSKSPRYTTDWNDLIEVY